MQGTAPGGMIRGLTGCTQAAGSESSSDSPAVGDRVRGTILDHVSEPHPEDLPVEETGHGRVSEGGLGGPEKALLGPVSSRAGREGGP